MPKFTLIAEHLDNNGEVESRVTHEFNEDFLSDVVLMMQEFLRGVGYYFDGELMILDEEREPSENYTHSDCYWDIDRNK